MLSFLFCPIHICVLLSPLFVSWFLSSSFFVFHTFSLFFFLFLLSPSPSLFLLPSHPLAPSPPSLSNRTLLSHSHSMLSPARVSFRDHTYKHQSSLSSLSDQHHQLHAVRQRRPALRHLHRRHQPARAPTPEASSPLPLLHSIPSTSRLSTSKLTLDICVCGCGGCCCSSGSTAVAAARKKERPTCSRPHGVAHSRPASSQRGLYERLRRPGRGYVTWSEVTRFGPRSCPPSSIFLYFYIYIYFYISIYIYIYR